MIITFLTYFTGYNRQSEKWEHQKFFNKEGIEQTQILHFPSSDLELVQMVLGQIHDMSSNHTIFDLYQIINNVHPLQR